MINPTFIIETAMFDDDAVCDALVKAAESHGCNTRIINYAGFGSDPRSSKDLEDTCVIQMSSINAIKQAKRNHRWYPGAFCDFSKLNCQTYYSYWFDYLLNKQHEFIPWKMVVHRSRSIYHDLGPAIFIRPDGNDKIFSGEVVVDKQFDTFAMMVDTYLGEEDNPLCVIAPASTPKNEYRIVVSQDINTKKYEYVTGSQYRNSSGVFVSKDVPECAIDLAVKAANIWSPHPIYCIDVCVLNLIGDVFLTPKIVECGSVNCAGLYMCDVDKVVRELIVHSERDYVSNYMGLDIS